MSFLPVQCHNCLSSKRQFYVFLQCKHFMCLTCCLYSTNLSNYTIRCCYINTKVSEELKEVVLQELEKQKCNKQLNSHSNKNQIDGVKQNQQSKCKIKQSNSISKLKDPLKVAQNVCLPFSHLRRIPTFGQMEKISNSKNDENKTPKKQQSTKQNKQSYESRKLTQNISQNQQSSYYPTFKNLTQRYENQQRQQYQIPTKKQSNLCWKNHQTTKDRILAKLEHQQYKINQIIKEHFY